MSEGHTYRSHVRVGQQYRCRDTGFIGVCKAITFYDNFVARVQLRALINSVPADHWFNEESVELVPEEKAGFST